MPTGQNTRSEIAYVAEVTYGTTPPIVTTNPILTRIPFISHSLQLKRAGIMTDHIQTNRMNKDVHLGNHMVEGDIVCDLNRADHNVFFPMLMMDGWNSNVLKTSNVQSFISIEERALDLSRYIVYKGLTCKGAKISMAPDQNIRAVFSMLGRTMTNSATSATPSAIAAESTAEPMDSFTGAVLEGGGAVTFITAFELDVQNDTENVYNIGSPLANHVSYGKQRVTGSITVLYEGATMIDKFMNETESSISITCKDRTGTNGLQFTIPKLRYLEAPAHVTGGKQRTITLPFVGLYDLTTDTNLRITRNVA